MFNVHFRMCPYHPLYSNGPSMKQQCDMWVHPIISSYGRCTRCMFRGSFSMTRCNLASCMSTHNDNVALPQPPAYSPSIIVSSCYAYGPIWQGFNYFIHSFTHYPIDQVIVHAGAGLVGSTVFIDSHLRPHITYLGWLPLLSSP